MTSSGNEGVVEGTTASGGIQGFRFTGDGTEYFAIWMVNLLLSVLTLGIYSAWAKVRREKYFHRNLLLDGSGFDYHGEPKAILRGRAIAFGILVVLSLAENYSPVLYWLIVVALLPAAPWLLVRALRFRAHNTSYRGLRLSFHGGYREALTVFVGYGLLALFSLGLALPLFIQRQKVFIFGNLRYGGATFRCELGAGELYGIFMKPALVGVGIAALAAIAVAAGVPTAMIAGVSVLALIGLVGYLFPYVRVKMTNAVWNRTTLADNRFVSQMTVWPYLRLVSVNMFMLVLTMGLFWPWASVRMARFRAECLGIELSTSLDDFIAGQTTEAAALGDEATDMLGLDISL